MILRPIPPSSLPFSHRVISSPLIGTDHEIAMRKGIDLAFPEGQNIIGSRHLYDNIKDYLVDNEAMDKPS